MPTKTILLEENKDLKDKIAMAELLLSYDLEKESLASLKNLMKKYNIPARSLYKNNKKIDLTDFLKILNG